MIDQPEKIEIMLNGQKIIFDDLNRLYDCGVEFDLELSGDQIKNILTKNPSIAYDLFQYGDDTVVGDNFYCALVEEICDESFDSVKNKHKDKYYDYVKNKALTKGYTLILNS